MTRYDIIYQYEEGDCEFYLCLSSYNKKYLIMVTQSASTTSNDVGIDYDTEEMSIEVTEVNDQEWDNLIKEAKNIEQKHRSCNLKCQACNAVYGAWCQFHQEYNKFRNINHEVD